MPPRSVCLNVFTTSLGHGSVKKEAEVVVKEMESKSDGTAEERKRHDSLQEDSLSTTSFTHSFASRTNASPVNATTIDVAALPADATGAADPFFSTTLPTTCSTCTRPPPSGHSLLRCSRCKRAYYCSRTCQKQAWKGHKADCDPVSAPSPSSVLETPDVSVPGSPAMATDEHHF
ncbi:hypothetical protein BU23DRAFT_560119 [Bimuria novae-zelandiae CBS 107.79]|uniref:MYND-type domain-containing protein n=1 Tax=Bimuria novae-zelandiae CBS 107.79 TaxID=1447943 RepID=A0A6A5URZ6_9PLEO|nr:hypothetical protein BU23DRAFT_560119 [Bimuria novae-zelandiae CBS 107.79]